MTNAAPKIEFVHSVPETTRVGGGKGGSIFTDIMRDMPAPAKSGKAKDAPMNIASFFIPATVPDTITEAKEREKEAKADVRRISNRMSGVARRITKQEPTRRYAMRTVKENDVWGLRVYRLEDGEAPAPAPAAAPPPPPPPAS